jgi:GTP:adenosylcobinamide-phosphate guanylyltransferase
MSGLSAVILAGGSTSPEWREQSGAEKRALVPFHDRPIVSWVIDAVIASGCVDTIIVVGNITDDPRVRCVQEGKCFLDSVKNGMAAVTDDYFLQVTADIPFLTSDGVKDFVDRSLALKADVCYPIIARSVCEQQFPDIKRTYVKLQEGLFTGGNLGLVNRSYIEARMGYLEKAYAARKKPLKLAAMIGFDTLARFILGQIIPSLFSIGYAERKVGRLIGGKLKGVITDYAEIGADIDTLEHWQQFQKLPFPAFRK